MNIQTFSFFNQNLCKFQLWSHSQMQFHSLVSRFTDFEVQSCLGLCGCTLHMTPQFILQQNKISANWYAWQGYYFTLNFPSVKQNSLQKFPLKIEICNCHKILNMLNVHYITSLWGYLMIHIGMMIFCDCRIRAKNVKWILWSENRMFCQGRYWLQCFVVVLKRILTYISAPMHIYMYASHIQ